MGEGCELVARVVRGPDLRWRSEYWIGLVCYSKLTQF